MAENESTHPDFTGKDDIVVDLTWLPQRVRLTATQELAGEKYMATLAYDATDALKLARAIRAAALSIDGDIDTDYRVLYEAAIAETEHNRKDTDALREAISGLNAALTVERQNNVGLSRALEAQRRETERLSESLRAAENEMAPEVQQCEHDMLVPGHSMFMSRKFAINIDAIVSEFQCVECSYVVRVRTPE